MEKLFRGEEAVEDDLVLDSEPLRPPGRATPSARIVRARPPRIFRVAAELARRGRDGNGVAAGADAALALAASTSGAPLPAHVRKRFEASLGADLASVRVHTGAESAAAADAVGAHAYTEGHDIHFAEGRYAPDDPFGLHLLAHEVAHTVQQSGGAPERQHKLEVSAPSDALEVEADRAADAMVAGQAASVSGGPAVTARSPGDPPAGQTQPQSPTGDPGNPPNAVNDSAGGNAGGKAEQQSSQKVKVTVTFTPKAGTPISFDAPTYLDLYKQVAARADAKLEAGDCKASPDENIVPGSDGNIAEANYTITIETMLPEWKQLAQQSPEDQARFKKWAASVAAHEAKHAKLFTDGYNKLKTAIIGPKQTDIDTQYKTVADAVKKAQDDFDNAEQPDPLPAPGGVTKVP